MRTTSLFLVLLIFSSNILSASGPSNYLSYHQAITRAEECIAKRQFAQSLTIYRQLSDEYPFIFLRDCKVAAQIAAHINDHDNLFFFLEIGMRNGWTFKEISKNQHFDKIKADKRWNYLKDHQSTFNAIFFQRLNPSMRAEMKKMFGEDQKRALRVALTPVRKWKERYTNRVFVRNNRIQVRRINDLIDRFGYPGEKIIGDKSWATVIISHNEHDTIYQELRPKLYKAFEHGEISAIDLAIIETWRASVNTAWKDKAFVVHESTIGDAEALHADSLRQSIGLRNINLNNLLIQMQKELKMNFYLSPFHGGLITIKQ